MNATRFVVPVALVLSIYGCGGSGGGSEDPAGAVAAGASGGGGPGAGSGGNGGGGTGGSGGAAAVCEPFGHFGAPENTFTLPGPSASGGMSYTDIQASFKDVDWSTLDRLYIPAGKYKFIQIGNLPQRDPGRPLVITNLGGQVQVGPNDPGGNYIWSMGGGSNWILTGRYDADAKTGDAAFPGHRCGDYAGSRGKYGFFSDDAFAEGQYLHMGISVGDATSYEIEFLEIIRSGFAGIRLLNKYDAAKPLLPMDNVRVHDNYLHDIAAEGVYFGWTGAPPSNIVTRLSIYNNRIVRTGNEALQIQNLGEGTDVHHNVFAFGALHWRDNDLGKYQDNNTQVQMRAGQIALHHNVFMGGAGNLLSLFSGPETGDAGRNMAFHDNYVADTLSLGGYLGGTSGADSTYTFERNFFRGLDFGYTPVDPMAKDPGVIFGINQNFTSPVAFKDNHWEGARKIVAGLAGGEGTVNKVTATGNVNGPVEPVAFVDSGYPSDTPTRRLEIWAPKATVAPNSPTIVYEPGALVMHDLDMYECLKQNSELVPPDHPEAWKKLPRPSDDLRVVKSSPYAEMGVH